MKTASQSDRARSLRASRRLRSIEAKLDQIIARNQKIDAQADAEETTWAAQESERIERAEKADALMELFTKYLAPSMLGANPEAMQKAIEQIRKRQKEQANASR